MTAETAPIRWGILGTGTIAGRFALGLAGVPDAALVAVGSRRAETARAFADAHGAVRAHVGVAALAADAEVDVVYVATPPHRHAPDTLALLRAGKAVLCEKPFALDAAEGREMVTAARDAGLFLMEAMWTRFLPALGAARALLARGAVGEAHSLVADLGIDAPFEASGRLFDPAMGGGALRDLGVYLVSLASWLLGPPSAVHAVARLGPTGVDEQTSLLLDHPGGAHALLTCSIRTPSPQEAALHGREGTLRIHAPLWSPGAVTLERPGEPPATRAAPFVGNGYGYQAAEVGRCLRAGARESPTLPLDETLGILETLDRARRPAERVSAP